jgi:LysR family nitrogen assimilation transcriptional regulator
LTAEGEELLVHARNILQSVEAAEETLRHHASSPVGTVTFGVPTSLSAVLCVPLIEAVQSQFPNVRLRLVETMTGTIVEWLKSGELDIGLIFAEGTVGGLVNEPLLTEELYLAAASRKALEPVLDSHGEVPLEALQRLPLVLPRERHGLRALVDQYLRRAGLSARVIVEIDVFSQIRKLVQRGQGMTVLSLAALYEAGLDPPLATARIVKPAIRRTVSLARADQRPQTKAARETGRLAARILRASAPEPWWRATPVG